MGGVGGRKYVDIVDLHGAGVMVREVAENYDSIAKRVNRTLVGPSFHAEVNLPVAMETGKRSGWLRMEGSGEHYLDGSRDLPKFASMIEGVAAILSERSGKYRQVDITRGHIEDAICASDLDDIEVAYIEWLVREAWREAIEDCDDLFWGKSANFSHPDGIEILNDFLAARDRGFILA